MSHDTRYVTTKECLDNITKIKEDLDIIKRALCGDDMRGGLIYDVNQLFGKISSFSACVNEIKGEMAEDKTDRKESRKMIIGFTISVLTATASLLVAIFK